ncbi:hypothetical protein CcCBS67573_g05317 [Chytriomyces confervae]|uniref:Uncharacterized protein n=1 Tax=Chytriomyces confervae TaxID=246404 RepID=A0A507FAR1_9FUNG|nr:hypothetical protein HDU80_006870 [Chytriomyces hyalinus]TPX73409.1 hypothetical protein CcCBS67573_g05317 [Chytriomyces confervae]
MSFFSFASDAGVIDRDAVALPGVAPPAATQTHALMKTQTGSDSSSADLFAWYAGPDPVSLVLESYTLALVTAPLVVVETLQEIQFHGKDQTPHSSELDAYESVAKEKQTVAVIPSLGSDVWRNIRTLSKSPCLGTLGFVKGNVAIAIETHINTAQTTGHFTTFLLQTLSNAAQPFVEESLNDAFDVFDDTHPVTNLLSHVLISTVLSPLELIRTRLIAQSVSELRYYGPFHAAAAIAATEGPYRFGALYAPQHVYATIICKAVSSLLKSLSHSIIKYDLGLSSEYNPILHTSAVLVFLAGEVFVSTPLELARKRLQVQSLKPSRKRKAGDAIIPFVGCVGMNNVRRYESFFEVIQRVIVEEAATSNGGSIDLAAEATSSGTSKTALATAGGYDDEMDAYLSAGSLNSPKKNADWQDLYSPSGSKRNLKSATSRNQSILTKYWKGLRSLYRGYWTRYSIRVVELAFEGLRDAGDNAWDI